MSYHKTVLASCDRLEVLCNEEWWKFDYKPTSDPILIGKQLWKIYNVLKGVLAAHDYSKKVEIYFVGEPKGVLGHTDLVNIWIDSSIPSTVQGSMVLNVFIGVAMHEYSHILYSPPSPQRLREGHPVGYLMNLLEDERIEAICRCRNPNYAKYFWYVKEYLCKKLWECEGSKVEKLSDFDKALYITATWIRHPNLLTVEEQEWLLPSEKILCEVLNGLVFEEPQDIASYEKACEVYKMLQKEYPEQSESGNILKKFGITERGDKKSLKGIIKDINKEGGGSFVDNVVYNVNEKLDDFELSKDQVSLSNAAKDLVNYIDSGVKGGRIIGEVCTALQAVKEGVTNIAEFHNCRQENLEEIKLSSLIKSSCVGPQQVFIVKTTKNTSLIEGIYDRAYEEVGARAKSLASKFLIRHADASYVSTEKVEGRLHSKNLAYGTITNKIFYKEEKYRTVGLTIGLLIDESGSMGSGPPGRIRIESARKIAVLLSAALKQVPLVDLYVYGHSSCDSSATKNSDCCLIRSFYGDKNNKNLENLGHLAARQENYDGFAIEVVGKRLLNIQNDNEKWLIVICDGCPEAGARYTGTSALEHTAKVVRSLSQKGLHIIGVQINDIKSFSKMYPRCCTFTNPEKLVSDMGKLVSLLVKNRTVEVRV